MRRGPGETTAVRVKYFDKTMAVLKYSVDGMGPWKTLLLATLRESNERNHAVCSQSRTS